MQVVRLLSQTTLSAVRTAVESVLNTWVQDWSVQPPQMSVSVVVYDSAAPSDKEVLVLRHSSGASAGLLFDEALWRKILFSGKAEQCPEDAIAKHLTARSQRDFVARLFMAFGFDGAELADTNDCWPAPKKHSGYMLCEVDCGEGRFELLLSPAFSSTTAKVRTKTVSSKLTARTEAVLNSECQARITLDLGQMHLQHLQSLSVGDTVQSDTPLSQPFEFRVGETLRLAGLLGKIGHNKAISLIKQ